MCIIGYRVRLAAGTIVTKRYHNLINKLKHTWEREWTKQEKVALIGVGTKKIKVIPSRTNGN